MTSFRRSSAILISVALAGCGGDRTPAAPGSKADSARIVSLEVALARQVIDVGETISAVAVSTDDRGARQLAASIAWATTTPSVATVSATGDVTGLAAGSTTITATLDTMIASASVTVSAAHQGAQVAISPALTTVARRGTIQLTAVLRDSTGAVATPQQIAWFSSDDAIASVSNTGLVTALEEGRVSVFATLDGHSAYALVRVTPLPSTIISIRMFAPDTLTSVADSVQVMALCTPQRPLGKVVGRIGQRAFAMTAVRVGALGLQEAWAAWVRMSDMTPGDYYAVATVYDTAGATATDSVRFKRKVNVAGPGVPGGGFKLIVPP